MQVRKRGLYAEAFQMTKDASKDRSTWPEWLQNAKEVAGTSADLCLELSPKGFLYITWNDYIVFSSDFFIGVFPESRLYEIYEKVPE